MVIVILSDKNRTVFNRNDYISCCNVWGAVVFSEMGIRGERWQMRLRKQADALLPHVTGISKKILLVIYLL